MHDKSFEKCHHHWLTWVKKPLPRYMFSKNNNNPCRDRNKPVFLISAGLFYCPGGGGRAAGHLYAPGFKKMKVFSGLWVPLLAVWVAFRSLWKLKIALQTSILSVMQYLVLKCQKAKLIFSDKQIHNRAIKCYPQGWFYKDPCLFSRSFISQSYYVIVGLIMSTLVLNLKNELWGTKKVQNISSTGFYYWTYIFFQHFFVRTF